THLAKTGKKVSALRAMLPNYFSSKKRVDLKPNMDIEGIFTVIKERYKQYKINDIDGVKIDFPQGWVHLRKSNTEPIIRVYSEAGTMEQAEKFGDAIIEEIKRIAKL
ncbi:MAG TPA: phosphoglucosamine mutase, partial [Paludibacteraceae bacterium]|nr:phosphoglucosamine mutase [Paludibacteraceae bacterium]